MATSLSFKYLDQRYLISGEVVDISRPFIPIRLAHGKKTGGMIYALVDSGSDRNLFPADLAETIGVNVKKGKPRKIGGIGQSSLPTYTHKIDFLLEKRKFNTEIDFSYKHQTPILGRNGFFNLFREVKFSEKSKTLELVI